MDGLACGRYSSRSLPIFRRQSSFWRPDLLVPHADLTVEGVGLNPTRRAVLDVLRENGRRSQGFARRRAPG